MWTDRPLMTIAVDLGCKATKQTNKQKNLHNGMPIYMIKKHTKCRASDFFKNWWAQVTHGAKKWWVIFWNDGPTADYTVKPVLSSHSKKKTNYLLMQVKSIAECSKGSILQSFRPALSYHLLLRSLFCLFFFFSGCLRQVLLYRQPTCTFCFVEFVDLL